MSEVAAKTESKVQKSQTSMLPGACKLFSHQSMMREWDSMVTNATQMAAFCSNSHALDHCSTDQATLVHTLV